MNSNILMYLNYKNIFYNQGNVDIVEEYLGEFELLLLRKDDYEDPYEFSRKYKIYTN